MDTARVRTRGSEASGDTPRDRGSAMVMAIFVLFLLTTLGVSLLFLSQNEQKMSRASQTTQQAFYMAEAGLEAARISLYLANGQDEFTQELDAAKGGNTTMDLLDPDAIMPIFDSAGALTGLTGVGDDQPLMAITPLVVGGGTRGWYAAFLTNDPAEGRGAADTDDRVSIVAVGAGPDRSFEVVEAIIERGVRVPLIPPATITLLGPPPVIDTGTSNRKIYIGDDCGGNPPGIPGYYAPVVGAVGSAGEAAADAAVNKNPTYEAGGYEDEEVFVDVTDPSEDASVHVGALPSEWMTCETWQGVLAELRREATYYCADGSSCSFSSASAGDLVFIDDDYTLQPTGSGAATLVITGTFTRRGNASWSGLVVAVGEGQYVTSGGGNGTVSGALIIADIAGPDNEYGTEDDCTGGDGGFANGGYDESGGGTSTFVYCTADITAANDRPYEIVEFLQR